MEMRWISVLWTHSFILFLSGDTSASSSQMQTHQGNYQQQQGGSAPNMTGSGGYQPRPMSNQPSQSGPMPQQMPSQSGYSK